MRCLLIFFVTGVLLGTVPSLSAQVEKKPIAKKPLPKRATARCVLVDGPRLRGFYLGQTVDEISKNIPGFRDAFDYQKASRSFEVSLSDWERKIDLAVSQEIELVSFDSTYSFGIDSGRELLVSSDFEGVSVNWWFIKEKLFAYQVYYSELDIDQDAKKFIKQISEKTILPEKGWRILWQGMAADLTCGGFKVFINAGYRNTPSITITDQKTEAKIIQLARTIELRKKAEEKERLRLEREERSTFKP